MKASLYEPLRHNLQIVGLCAFALQPVLDLLGRYPEFLVAHRATAGEIVSILLLLALVVPLPLVLLQWFSWSISRKAHRVVHGVFVGLLAALIVLPAARTVSAPASAIFALALAIGALISFTVSRLRLLSTTLSLSAAALPVFVGLFVLRPSTQDLLRPHTALEVSGSGAGRDINVVYLIYDALPMSSLLDESRRIDPVRYPNIAALAQDGVSYYNFSAGSQKTDHSVPSMLTGRRTAFRKKPDYTGHPENLFSLLQESHDLVVEEAITYLCPEDVFTQRDTRHERSIGVILSDLSVLYLHLLLPEGSREKLPDVTHNWTGFASRRRTIAELAERRSENVERHERFLSRIEPAARPTLYFLHTVLPHLPYQYLPSGKLYSTTGREPMDPERQAGIRVKNAWATLHSYQRHLLQLGYVDRQVGEVVARLKETGLYEDSMVIFTADHGVSFKPGIHYRKLVPANVGDIAPVPLVVKYPDSSGAGSESFENFEGIDLVPTIADVVDMRIPWEVDGHSIVDPGRVERTSKFITGEIELTRELELPSGLIEAQFETLDRKLKHFGSGRKRDGLFRLGDEHDLVGSPLSELELVELPEIPVSIETPSSFENVDPDANFVPAEVIGYAEGSEADLRALRIAVAVNGVVRATTRPYRVWNKRTTAVWAALVPEKSFEPGENRIEALIIRERPKGVVLERSTSEGEGPSFLNMALGRRMFLGVEEEGIRDEAGAARRWTDGHGVIKIPIRDAERPTEIALTLASGRKQKPVLLEIRLNGSAAYSDSLPAALTRIELPLPEVVGDLLTVELISESFTRRAHEKGRRPPHRFGIQIREIMVLDGSD